MRKLIIGLIVVLLVACGLVYTILTPRRAPLKLPVTQKAMGRTITLKSVKRTSEDIVQVTLVEKWSRSAASANTDLTVTLPRNLPETECEVDFTSVEGLPFAGGFQRVIYRVDIKVPSDARFINLSKEYVRDRPSNRVDIIFNNIAVNTLPVTKSFNGTAVTLQSAAINKPFRRSDCCIVYRGSSAVPSGDPCIALGVKIDTRQDFVRSYGGQVLGDGRGNYFSVASAYDVKGSEIGTNIPKVNTAPTLGENIVSCFNRERGYNMWQHRCNKEYDSKAMALARSVGSSSHVYVFPAINPPPEKISFKMSGSYLSDSKDKARIEFRNVPIQQ